MNFSHQISHPFPLGAGQLNHKLTGRISSPMNFEIRFEAAPEYHIEPQSHPNLRSRASAIFTEGAFPATIKSLPFILRHRSNEVAALDHPNLDALVKVNVDFDINRAAVLQFVCNLIKIGKSFPRRKGIDNTV